MPEGCQNITCCPPAFLDNFISEDSTDVDGNGNGGETCYILTELGEIINSELAEKLKQELC